MIPEAPLRCARSSLLQSQLRAAFIPASKSIPTPVPPLSFLTPRQPHLHRQSPLQTIPQNRTLHRSTAFQSSSLVQNPVYNDKGEELVLSISERAAKRLSQISRADSSEKGPQVLRINVEAGGCHGFQYLMKLERESKIKQSQSLSTKETPKGQEEGTEDAATSKTPFDVGDEDVQDTVIASETYPDAKIVLDTPSLELLAGSTVDYTKELIGAQFKIVGNPRASSSCGCGTSFDIVE